MSIRMSPTYRRLMESHSVEHLEGYLYALETQIERGQSSSVPLFCDLTYQEEVLCVKQVILERKMLAT